MSLAYFSKLVPVCAGIVLSSVVWASTSKIDVTLNPSVHSKASGTVTFTQLKDNEIEIEGKLTGLTPGKHGMHVHEKGDCSDISEGFKKSGGHFNPEGAHHGPLMDGHAGDLGNITADAKGDAHFKITTSKFNFLENDKRSIHGTALVVHAGVDDEKTDPAGNSGDRILCGVVK